MNAVAENRPVGNRHPMADCLRRRSPAQRKLAAAYPSSDCGGRSDLAQMLASYQHAKETEAAASAAFLAGGQTDELGSAADDAGNEAHRLIRAMVEPRALTIVDVMHKVSAYALMYDGDLRDELDADIADTKRFATNERLAASILRDLVALSTPVVDGDLVALGEEFSRAAYGRLVAADLASRGAPAESPAEKAYEAVLDEVTGLTDRIEGMRATSLTGMLVKLAALQWCRMENEGEPHSPWTGEDFSDQATTDVRLVASILNDLAAIGNPPR